MVVEPQRKSSLALLALHSSDASDRQPSPSSGLVYHDQQFSRTRTRSNRVDEARTGAGEGTSWTTWFRRERGAAPRRMDCGVSARVGPRGHGSDFRLNDGARHARDETCGFLGNSRSEEHTSELQSRENLVCRLLLEKKKVLQTKN